MDTSSPQRAFLQWFSETAPRFAVPIRTKESDDCFGSTIGNCTEGASSLHLEFIGNPALNATLTSSEINVSVEWQGECWDFLLCLDVMPRRVIGGYVCEHCKAERRITFPNLETLLRDHLFEPFLEWLNGKLAAADAIGLYASPSGGWTRAELISTRDAQRTKPNMLIPLRVSLHR